MNRKIKFLPEARKVECPVCSSKKIGRCECIEMTDNELQELYSKMFPKKKDMFWKVRRHGVHKS